MLFFLPPFFLKQVTSLRIVECLNSSSLKSVGVRDHIEENLLAS